MSFAKQALGFVGKINPWVTAATTGLGIFGALKGRKKGQVTPFMSPQTQALSQEAAQRGQEVYDVGLPLARGASDYWLKLLSPDRQARSEALAVERDATARARDAAIRNLMESGAVRGGTMDLARSNIEREAFRQNVLGEYGLRAGAAQQAGGLFNQLAGASEAFTGQAAQMMSQADYLAQRQKEVDAANRRAVGGGIFKFLFPGGANIPWKDVWGKILRKPTGSSPPAGTTWPQ